MLARRRDASKWHEEVISFLFLFLFLFFVGKSRSLGTTLQLPYREQGKGDRLFFQSHHVTDRPLKVLGGLVGHGDGRRLSKRALDRGIAARGEEAQRCAAAQN